MMQMKKRTKCNIAENVKSDSHKLRDKSGCNNFFILFQAFFIYFQQILN